MCRERLLLLVRSGLNQLWPVWVPRPFASDWELLCLNGVRDLQVHLCLPASIWQCTFTGFDSGLGSYASEIILHQEDLLVWWKPWERATMSAQECVWPECFCVALIPGSSFSPMSVRLLLSAQNFRMAAEHSCYHTAPWHSASSTFL